MATELHPSGVALPRRTQPTAHRQGMIGTLAWLTTETGVGTYRGAAAVVRRHSSAAAATRAIVTMNRPTTIIHSTDPSC